MEFLKQARDEVEIKGPEGKYDIRKLNSYPSKVECRLPRITPLLLFEIRPPSPDPLCFARARVRAGVWRVCAHRGRGSRHAPRRRRIPRCETRREPRAPYINTQYLSGNHMSLLDPKPVLPNGAQTPIVFRGFPGPPPNFGYAPGPYMGAPPPPPYSPAPPPYAGYAPAAYHPPPASAAYPPCAPPGYPQPYAPAPPAPAPPSPYAPPGYAQPPYAPGAYAQPPYPGPPVPAGHAYPPGHAPPPQHRPAYGHGPGPGPGACSHARPPYESESRGYPSPRSCGR